MLISSCCSGGGMSAGTDGGGRLSVSMKCSAHLFLWSPSLVMVLPSLSFTGRLGFLVFPESTLVISYSLFIFLWPDAVSALLVMFSI